MKIRLSFLSLMFGLALVPAMHAEDAPKMAAHDEDSTELGDKMDKINGAWKKLRANAADASKNEDSLKQVALIRAGMQDSIHLEPAKKADVPAADQAKFVADYQSKMKEFITELDKLEAALKAGKNDEAAAQVKNLGDLQKQDHKAFKKGKKS